MTAEIINLRQARKARARVIKGAHAEENRARFGTSKAERQRRAAETDRAARQLDGAKRNPVPERPPATDPGNSPTGDEDPPAGGAA